MASIAVVRSDVIVGVDTHKDQHVAVVPSPKSPSQPVPSSPPQLNPHSPGGGRTTIFVPVAINVCTAAVMGTWLPGRR